MTRAEWKVVTEPQPTVRACSRDLGFAWAVCRHVKSNAIVLVRTARHRRRRGADEPRRFGRDRDQKAGERARGAVLASDAFFPFADSIEPPPRPASRPSSSPAARAATTK